MQLDAIASLSTAVDAALTQFAPGILQSWDVSPSKRNADDTYVVISIRDVETETLGTCDGLLQYQDMADMELIFYTPRGDGDSDLRAKIDAVKNALENTTAGSVDIDDATQDTPFDDENSQLVIYLNFATRSYYIK